MLVIKRLAAASRPTTRESVGTALRIQMVFTLLAVLTSKPIEHGPKKLLGFDRTAKDNAGFLRRVNVLAGTRIYSIQVLSLNQEHLNSEEAAEFFDSFTIHD